MRPGFLLRDSAQVVKAPASGTSSSAELAVVQAVETEDCPVGVPPFAALMRK